MHFDVIVIGAGIVGLASAYKILEQDPTKKLLILEKEDRISKHQSGNNSGVIHSGIYYKPGSLRAINCLRGYDQLLDFCKAHEIKHEICGKVIVATKENQLASLNIIYERGVANGMDGLKMISPEELKEHEPHVSGIKAIWVPQAGIADYPALARKYQELIENGNGSIHFNEAVEDIKIKNKVEVITGKNTYQTDLVINCAGLYSDHVAKLTVNKLGLKILPFRGEYFKIKEERKYLVKHLVYPAPDPDFPWLGVHFTRMVNGDIEAGPNAVLAFRREGYKKLDIHLGELYETITYSGFLRMATKFWRQGLDEYNRSFFKSAFTRSLQGLIPEIQEDDLVEGGAGVRALACDSNGNLLDDFVFEEAKGVINVLNAPSPAATSSLSIGQTIAEMALKTLT